MHDSYFNNKHCKNNKICSWLCFQTQHPSHKLLWWFLIQHCSWKGKLDGQYFLLVWLQGCISTSGSLKELPGFSPCLSGANSSAERECSETKLRSKDAFSFYIFNRNKTKMGTKIERIDNANLSQSKGVSKDTALEKVQRCLQAILQLGFQVTRFCRKNPL